MYKAIISRRVRHVWRELQLRNTDALLSQFAEPFEHAFIGDHALGGRRHIRDAQVAWFTRLFRLFPDISFTVRDVFVHGWPWSTHVVAIVDVLIPSQKGYINVVMQHVHLRYGRVTRVENLEDTQRLSKLLASLAEAGQSEALAAPIEDHNWQETASMQKLEGRLIP